VYRGICSKAWWGDTNISGLPDRVFRWSNPIHLLAYGLGSGLSPIAPGTLGTIAAIPLYLLMRPLDPGIYLTIVVGLFLLGIWLCGVTAREMGLHDPGGIVWDEWVGLLVTLWLLPDGWVWLLAGFGLFRFFDILKPWPIGWLDRRVQGGTGIMLDDLLAGVFGFLTIQLTAHLISIL